MHSWAIIRQSLPTVLRVYSWVFKGVACYHLSTYSYEVVSLNSYIAKEQILYNVHKVYILVRDVLL